MNHLYKYYWVVLLIIIGLSPVVQAQNPDIFEQMKAKYPDEMGVYLDLRDEVMLDIDGDSILATVDSYQDLLLLDERSKGGAKDKVYLSHFKELLELEAATLVPVKNKYKTIKVKEFKEKSEMSSGIFYDDFRSKTFVYPAIAPGVRTVLHEKQALKNARFLTAFYFGSYLPVQATSLKITFHKDIDLKYKLFNTEGLDIQFTKETKGNFITYLWKMTEVEGYDSEGGAPKASYYLPHIAYHIASYKGKTGNKKLLSGVEDLFSWYSGLTCNVNLSEDENLKEVVGELTKGATSEEEKVKNIFYWVQDNIKYVAFEDGMRGFIPHDANYVYDKRYGDCKDMASITNNMLKLAGIESYLTWIGSRDIPYRYTELPTPMVDNHMIVTYPRNNGELYFLDATSSHTSLGMPSSMIQGKEALLDLGDGKFKIVQVPVLDKERNQFTDTVEFTLKDGVLVGKGKASMTGYTRVFNSYRITGRQDDKEEEFVRQLLRKGSNKFFIDDYKIANTENKDRPLAIDYSFRIQDYHKEIAGEIYLNLNLEKPFNNSEIDLDSRKLPLENDYYYMDSQVQNFEVPEGYAVDYLPPAAKYKHDLFGFDIKYAQEGNVITQEKVTYINYLIMEREQFPQWNEMVELLNEAYREVVILKKQ